MDQFAALHDTSEVQGNMPQPWAGLDDARSGWQLEHRTASTAAFPLEGIKILKTNSINVERSSPRQ